jgi:hypothetical protein
LKDLEFGIEGRCTLFVSIAARYDAPNFEIGLGVRNSLRGYR